MGGRVDWREGLIGVRLGPEWDKLGWEGWNGENGWDGMGEWMGWNEGMGGME